MALDFPSNPTNGQVFGGWQWDGTKWIVHNPPLTVPIVFFFSGKPLAASEVVVPLAIPMTIPANLVGSASFVGTVPTAAAVFNLQQIVSGTPTTIGTISWAANGTNPTFAGAGGALVTGNSLAIVAPATQDGTMANIGITILGTRS